MAKTLQNLIDEAWELADFTDTDDFISLERWISWVNQGVTELHRLVANANPDQFFTTIDFTLAGGVDGNEYTLPADFVAIRGLSVNPGQANRMTVHKFNLGERDQGRSTFALFSGMPAPRQYRVVSKSKLIIEPQESAGGTYRLYYVAAPSVLAFPKTVAFSLATGDTPSVPPPGSLDGTGAWLLANGNDAEATDIPLDGGFDLDLTFTSTNLGFSGTYHVVAFGDSPQGFGQPTFSTSNLASTAGYGNPASGSGTYTYQPDGTVNELDDALEPYFEYIAIVTALKGMAKGEDDTNDLLERRNVLRQDILDSAGNDDNEPNSIVDVQDGTGGGGPGWW